MAERSADFWSRSRFENRQVLIVCDDADAGQPEALDLVQRFVQFDAHQDSRRTVVLATTDSGLTQLPLGLLELAELAITLESWDPTDTARFIDFALRRSGLPATGVHRRRFVQAVARFGRRYPCCGLTQLARFGCLPGADLDLSQIDVDTVTEACHELGVIAQAN